MNKFARALRLIFNPFNKKTRPYRGLKIGYRRTLVNRWNHPMAVAEWRENKPFFSKHVIKYRNGKTLYHTDFGNPYMGVRPFLAHAAENVPTYAYPGAAGAGAYYGVRALDRRHNRNR